jgi:hypothetical protein
MIVYIIYLFISSKIQMKWRALSGMGCTLTWRKGDLKELEIKRTAGWV